MRRYSHNSTRFILILLSRFLCPFFEIKKSKNAASSNRAAAFEQEKRLVNMELFHKMRKEKSYEDMGCLSWIENVTILQNEM